MPNAQLEIADDTVAAEWLADGLDVMGRSVGSVVPAGFGAYVRVFHPATRRASDGSESAVRWDAVAAATGKHAHAAMQLPALTGVDMEADDLPGVYDYRPEIGTLPAAVASSLV